MFPETVCPTGPVYRRFDDLQPNAQADEDRVRRLATRPLQRDSPFNDLAAAALDLHPNLQGDIDRIRPIVERPIHVSGSGSTLFTLCDDSLQADLLAAVVSEQLQIPAIAVQTAPGLNLGEVER